MYDICYGGRRASEFGVCISDRPDIPAAKKKMESIEIAGRDGMLYLEEEAYEESEIEIPMNYIGPEDALDGTVEADPGEWLSEKEYGFDSG